MRKFARMMHGTMVGTLMFAGPAALCQEVPKDQTALAAALRGKHITLHAGLVSAAANGTPISGKYELENGKLQLSVYTEKGGAFSEVIVNHHTGKVTKSEKVTDAGDLKAAGTQHDAMAKTKSSLASALQKALAANPGYGAVSAAAVLKDGRPAAEITLLRGTTYKSVTQPLN